MIRKFLDCSTSHLPSNFRVRLWGGIGPVNPRPEFADQIIVERDAAALEMSGDRGGGGGWAWLRALAADDFDDLAGLPLTEIVKRDALWRSSLQALIGQI